MSNQEDLEQVELSIEQAKKVIARNDTLDRLADNKDFIEIIEKGYFQEEASRLVLLKAAPAMQTEEHQRDITNKINSIGVLRQHFVGIRQLARMANQSMEADEATRTEILAEVV